MVRVLVLLAGAALAGPAAALPDAGWGLGGSDCRAAYAGPEAEAEAWIAGYRSALDDVRGGGAPAASLGFNAVQEACRLHPDWTFVRAVRSVFPLRRR